jgi:hypothetical protein
MQSNLKKISEGKALSQVNRKNATSFIRPQTAISPKAQKLIPTKRNLSDLLNSRNSQNRIANRT